MDAPELTDLFLHHVFSPHGVSAQFVSDHGEKSMLVTFLSKPRSFRCYTQSFLIHVHQHSRSLYVPLHLARTRTRQQGQRCSGTVATDCSVKGLAPLSVLGPDM
jgi:hypothetical protein